MNFKKLINIDWIIFIFSISLNIIGLFTLYSISTTNIRGNYFVSEFQSQIIYSVIGYFALIVCVLIPFFYFKASFILSTIFILNLLLLGYTAFWGVEINGVKRWVILNTALNSNTVITIQPSEFAKVALILINSILLSKINLDNAIKVIKVTSIFQIKINKYYFLSIVASVSIIILIFLQKSLSVTLVLLLIYLFMLISSVQKKMKLLIIGGISLSTIILFQPIISITNTFKTTLIIILLILFILSITSYKLQFIKPKLFIVIIMANFIIGFWGLPFVWNNLLHQYQKERITNFINSESQDLLSEGYQQNQSIISIGAGQLFGQGFMQVINDRVLLLPEPTTDFIFAIFAYKFGFTGVIFIFLIYSIVILRIFYLADKVYDRQSELILIGVGSMILIQLFVNIGMNLGLLPVGGTTLPFISAGGSSLISMFLSLGIVQNCIATNKTETKIIIREEKILINGWNI